MQVDGTTFGIIPDTFQTILNNQLANLQNTFLNANSINSPSYALLYVSSLMDQLNQAALASLWNAINANTAQGLGLEILANTVLNLTKNPLIPSVANISVTIGNIYSSCQIQITVSAVGVSPPYTIPVGWSVSGVVSPNSPYQTQQSYNISTPGIYFVEVFSTDTSTPIPESAFNSGQSVSGLTFSNITNPATANLGSLTIPTSWQVTASSLGSNSPVYSPNFPLTFKEAGTYNFNIYSQNIVTPIYPTQLNTFSSSFNGVITAVTNNYAAILGISPETDAQFSARRRTYLNVQGQTYYGLELAILNLQVPSLKSIFIQETITNQTNYSLMIIETQIASSSSGIVIPEGWPVYVSGSSPDPNYMTLQEYTFQSSGTQYIPVYSTDISTRIPIGGVISAGSPYPIGVTSVTNLDPNILGETLVPNGLGQRGYTIYLAYPIINPESYVVMQLDVTNVGVSPPYTIPVGWQAFGFETTFPYETIESYAVSAAGIYDIVCYSQDLTTVVPANMFTNGTPVSGIIFSATNPSPNVLGGGFDVNDPYLQQIAETAFNYHPLGTQFYASSVGATLFTIPTQYPGYTYQLYLNPFQTIQISCNLLLIYNSDPQDAGFSNGTFNTNLLPTLQTNILELINTYFLSKTLPTDLVYYINELTELIQNSYTGIVALIGNSNNIFSFGTLNPVENNLVFLRRIIGSNFQLNIDNFNFNAMDKDLL